LFDVVLDQLPDLLPAPEAPVLAALDDTILKKTGRRIPGVKVLRDPDLVKALLVAAGHQEALRLIVSSIPSYEKALASMWRRSSCSPRTTRRFT
jgi:hypothetical protein